MSVPSRFDELATVAERYGRLSVENYSIIRNVAENISTGFCAWMKHGKDKCVYLVPPEGPWLPHDYRSGAFSVSGGGFLPLAPIAFGLAVRVSHTGDWIRMVLTAAKKGPLVKIAIAKGRAFDIALPVNEADLEDLFGHLHAHLIGWFADQADLYEHGDYGNHAIGFDFLHNPLVEAEGGEGDV